MTHLFIALGLPIVGFLVVAGVVGRGSLPVVRGPAVCFAAVMLVVAVVVLGVSGYRGFFSEISGQLVQSQTTVSQGTRRSQVVNDFAVVTPDGLRELGGSIPMSCPLRSDVYKPAFSFIYFCDSSTAPDPALVRRAFEENITSFFNDQTPFMLIYFGMLFGLLGLAFATFLMVDAARRAADETSEASWPPGPPDQGLPPSSPASP